MKKKRVALVVDWLTEGFGGGERVIKAIHDIFPDAPIYTSQYRPAKTKWLGDADVRTGRLNILPVSLRRFIPFLRYRYFQEIDLSEYDLVISITGAEAKAVKVREDATHVSYMHAATQYYWSLHDQYMENPGFGLLNPLVRFFLKLFLKPLQQADYQAAQRPTVVIANSSYVQSEIKKYYHRDSVVVWPNVDVDKINNLVQDNRSGLREGYVVFGRQVSWKRIDLAIEASIVSNKRIVVVGDGPENGRLRQIAANNPLVSFVPSYNDISEIIGYIRSAEAFIFPSFEPFGIAPVEALAAGTPVIALRSGGSLDFVREGRNGVFFSEQTVSSVVTAMQKLSTMSLKEDDIKKSVQHFSTEQFQKRIMEVVNDRK